MPTETTTKTQLSQARKSVREQKKELKRLRDSRSAAKTKCNNLTKALKIQKLRLKETQESRNKWKLEYKEERKKTEELKQLKSNLENLFGLKEEELSNLRMQIALEKKSAKNSP